MSIETDQVLRRETEIDAPSEDVWHVTDAGTLERWLGDEVELEPEVGSEVRVVDGDEERSGEVLHVEDGERLTFSWSREGEDPSFVEFEVVELPDHRTLFRVTETAPAWAPTALVGVGARWTERLGALSVSCALAFA